VYNLAAHRVVDELVESRRSAKRPPAADIALILDIKDELKRRAAVPAAHEQQAQCANACKEGTMHSHWNRFPADVVRKQELQSSCVEEGAPACRQPGFFHKPAKANKSSKRTGKQS
jgi:hypothetical protein